MDQMNLNLFNSDNAAARGGLASASPLQIETEAQFSSFLRDASAAVETESEALLSVSAIEGLPVEAAGDPTQIADSLQGPAAENPDSALSELFWEDQGFSRQDSLGPEARRPVWGVQLEKAGEPALPTAKQIPADELERVEQVEELTVPAFELAGIIHPVIQSPESKVSAPTPETGDRESSESSLSHEVLLEKSAAIPTNIGRQTRQASATADLGMATLSDGVAVVAAGLNQLTGPADEEKQQRAAVSNQLDRQIADDTRSAEGAVEAMKTATLHRNETLQPQTSARSENVGETLERTAAATHSATESSSLKSVTAQPGPVLSSQKAGSSIPLQSQVNPAAFETDLLSKNVDQSLAPSTYSVAGTMQTQTAMPRREDGAGRMDAKPSDSGPVKVSTTTTSAGRFSVGKPESDDTFEEDGGEKSNPRNAKIMIEGTESSARSVSTVPAAAIARDGQAPVVAQAGDPAPSFEGSLVVASQKANAELETASIKDSEVAGVHNSHEVIEQLVERARLVRTRSATSFEVLLNPRSLGRVQIETVLDAKGSLRAHIAVEDPRVEKLLRKDATLLVTSLREAGLELDQFEIRNVTNQHFSDARGTNTQTGQEQRHTHGQQHRPSPNGFGRDLAEDGELETTKTSHADGRLHYYA